MGWKTRWRKEKKKSENLVAELLQGAKSSARTEEMNNWEGSFPSAWHLVSNSRWAGTSRRTGHMWRDADPILLSPKPGDEGLTHLLGQLCFIFSPCLLSMLEDKGLWPSHLILGDLVQVTSLGSMTPSSARGEMRALGWGWVMPSCHECPRQGPPGLPVFPQWAWRHPRWLL